jgi:preprotein translocase subunit SecG
MVLPINTVVMLVVLLVLVAILLSRGGSNLTDIGGDKNECEILC